MNTPTGTEALVCEDIARRQAHGLAKYGISVADAPLSLRQWLQHAYEETLDKAVYLKRAIAEMDGQGAQQPKFIFAQADDLGKLAVKVSAYLCKGYTIAGQVGATSEGYCQPLIWRAGK